MKRIKCKNCDRTFRGSMDFEQHDCAGIPSDLSLPELKALAQGKGLPARHVS